ncbi:hypothetical protein, partial [Subdoligranulum variabile]|uniref:hypothetical protein n=1 Tax=Subdoligranulum variabile TaxID=214851 RepID=UPI0026ED1B23
RHEKGAATQLSFCNSPIFLLNFTFYPIGFALYFIRQNVTLYSYLYCLDFVAYPGQGEVYYCG